MTTRRYYANAAPQVTLQTGVTSTATSATINQTFTGWPTSYPYAAVFEKGTANEEAVLVTAVVGSTATITRGYDGYANVSHLAGATLDQVVLRVDLDDASAHVNATTAVHGIAGSVVGTTDAQTLTNKTLTTPTISNPTVTGTQTVAASHVTGNETVDGNLAVTGTLASGAQSVTGSVYATGTVQGATVTSTGAVNAASAVISGNETVGGTHAVTGAATAASYTANGNGAVSGVVVPHSYTNEAAATAGLPSPAAGTVVYLSAPTGGSDAGPFMWDGSAWHRTSPLVKRVTVSYTHHTASGQNDSGTVSFGFTFASAPTVIVQNNSTGGGGGGDGFFLSIPTANVTTTGCTVRSFASTVPGIDHTWNITIVAFGQQ